MNEQQGHGADPEGRGQGGLATAFDLAAFRLSMIAPAQLRCLNTVLAVCEYVSFANHGKRKVAAHRLKLGK